MALTLKIYEDVFDHQSFTGRSGTFYKYEGLGSIYWHMVSKLLLAVQENYYLAASNNEDKSILDKLFSYYYEIREGLGITNLRNYMELFRLILIHIHRQAAGRNNQVLTGQVKEDIISRFGELGVEVVPGKDFLPFGITSKRRVYK